MDLTPRRDTGRDHVSVNHVSRRNIRESDSCHSGEEATPINYAKKVPLFLTMPPQTRRHSGPAQRIANIMTRVSALASVWLNGINVPGAVSSGQEGERETWARVARASPKSPRLSLSHPFATPLARGPLERALASSADPSARLGNPLRAEPGERIAEPSLDRIKRISLGLETDRANKPLHRRHRRQLVFQHGALCMA